MAKKLTVRRWPSQFPVIPAGLERPPLLEQFVRQQAGKAQK
jgi:hypothetical protein